LQKVGGGVRFIHRLLPEHFAAMAGEGKWGWMYHLNNPGKKP
jgi:hypothetical protein